MILNFALCLMLVTKETFIVYFSLFVTTLDFRAFSKLIIYTISFQNHFRSVFAYIKPDKVSPDNKLNAKQKIPEIAYKLNDLNKKFPLFVPIEAKNRLHNSFVYFEKSNFQALFILVRTQDDGFLTPMFYFVINFHYFTLFLCKHKQNKKKMKLRVMRFSAFCRYFV